MISRRTLLATAASFAASAIAAPNEIIDTHTHFYDPSRPQGVPWPPKTDSLLYRTVLPSHFIELTKPFGVTGTIQVESSAWVADNQWMLDIAKANPIIKGVVGHLEPGSKESHDTFDRLRENRRYLGIRLSGRTIAQKLDSPDFIADLKRLAAANLELDAIGGTDMYLTLVHLTDRIPNLRVVINHMPFRPHAEDAAFRELGKRPQIYSKVSGVLPDPDGREPIDRLWDNFGEDRLVYGSNWPVSDKAGSYAEVFTVVRDYFAAKGSEASEKFFWKNSKAAYRWP